MSLETELRTLLNDTAARGGGIRGKVKKENLDDEVIDLIEKNQVITLSYPDGTKVDVPRKNMNPDFLKVVDDLGNGNNVFLVGEAGTGKTHLAKAVAKATKRFPRVVPCNQWTAPSRFMGGQTMEGFTQGALIDAWRQGDLLILDEMTKLDPNTAGVLNDALALVDQKDAIIFDGEGEPHKKHDKFAVIATGNTLGKIITPKYAGNNKQDASLLDRFSGSVYFIEFNRDIERALNFTKVFEICDKMRSVLIDLDSEEIITLRVMKSMSRTFFEEMERETGAKPKVPEGKTLKDSVESYLASIADEEERKEVREKAEVDFFFNTYKNIEIYKADKKRLYGK